MSKVLMVDRISALYVISLLLELLALTFFQIGDALNLGFSPEGLLSDLIVQNQTGTAEGGPNYVEFLTRCAVAANTTTDPRTCERQLWDFAFAGADISTAYTPLHHNYTVSLVNQTRQFAEYADPVLSTFIDKDNTLVDVWIGINDIGDSAKYNVSFPAFYEDLVSTLFDAIEENVYSKGYRAYLFLLLPPLNRTPPNLIRAAGPLPNATMIEWYNEALQQHAWKFKAAHADTDVLVFDTTTFLNYVLDHPTEYGITNTTDYCAGYDQPYVNVDPGRYGCAPLDQYL